MWMSVHTVWHTAKLPTERERAIIKGITDTPQNIIFAALNTFLVFKKEHYLSILPYKDII